MSEKKSDAHRAIDPTRHWNTWDSVYPLQMTHLPTGLRLTPCAYAASKARFTRFSNPALDS